MLSAVLVYLFPPLSFDGQHSLTSLLVRLGSGREDGEERAAALQRQSLQIWHMAPHCRSHLRHSIRHHFGPCLASPDLPEQRLVSTHSFNGVGETTDYDGRQLYVYGEGALGSYHGTDGLVLSLVPSRSARSLFVR